MAAALMLLIGHCIYRRARCAMREDLYEDSYVMHACVRPAPHRPAHIQPSLGLVWETKRESEMELTEPSAENMNCLKTMKEIIQIISEWYSAVSRLNHLKFRPNFYQLSR
ncbi:unnamed protein product [Caenorhabditis auriculariae]|uniref:Uncharacterized protein n=1 Tax=Caenorhabditis auriculariae TaxID=2777116 RepID=A0A8S1HFB9_9PELO|nr:unnamed protein product [Caenorhabditis auriculariae]